MMESARKRRLTLAGLTLSLIMLGLTATPGFQGLSSLPHHVRLVVGQDRQISPTLPITLYIKSDRDRAISLNGNRLLASRWQAVNGAPLSLKPLELGRYELDVRLLGLIPVRRLTVDAVAPRWVVPGGQSIGVLVRPGGVVVVGGEPVLGEDGRRHFPADEAGLKEGDLIIAIDGNPVRDKETTGVMIANAGEERGSVRVTLRRGADVLEKVIPLVYDRERERFLAGLWIMDGTTGVGTLTFYDPETLRYGALGHLVTDGAGKPYDVAEGSVVEAFVAGVRKGRPGEPGEKMGVFLDNGGPLGTIERNTRFGIYGFLQRPVAGPLNHTVEVALEDETRQGPAQIVTVVAGRNPELFDVTIEQVFPRAKPGGRGMVIRVTDARLINVTGGIVQGMSGSPILQEGKLVGAVTHVFVNDPARGYGVLADWMLQEMPNRE